MLESRSCCSLAARTNSLLYAGLSAYAMNYVHPRIKLPSRHKRVVALAVCFAITVATLSVVFKAVAASGRPHDLMAQLARVLVLIENHYVYPVDRSKLLQGAVTGMVAQLDPHSAYLPAQQFAEFQQDTEGKFVGIGVEVDVRSGSMIVLRTVPNSPAQKADLRPGDRIEAVDGWPTRGQPIDRVIEKIRGNPGTSVRLLVYRPDAQKPLEVTVVRQQVRVDSVLFKRLDNNIAYVGIKQFQRGTHTELLKAIAQMRAANPAPLAGLLLDLRTNSGGLVDESLQVADELLDSGVIFTTRARGRVLDEVYASSGGAGTDLAVVVLVNQFTASAAELVAGALQDNRRALIIGATTFGKGSVQSIVELPDDAAIKLTTSLYYTPSGRCIQAQGIQPDIKISPPPKPGGVMIVQERDIEGHLPPSTNQSTKRTENEPVATTSDIVLLGDVPSNPASSSDPVLARGYQEVLQRVAMRQAR